MGRPQRLDPHGGIHHIFNRSARRYDAFLDDRDRQTFLKCARESIAAVGGEMLAVCLMGNHFHMIVRFPTGGLSLCLKLLKENYTRLFNQAHGYDGPLFRSRFESNPIFTDEALLTMTRYVHRNPLELGFSIESYRWSSHRFYLGAARRPAWLHVELVVSMLGGVEAYRKFVHTDWPSDEWPMGAARGQMLPVPAVAQHYPALGPIDDAVLAVAECEPATLRESQRGVTNLPRLVALVIADEKRIHPAEQIAEHFGYASKAAMRKGLASGRRELDNSAAARNLWRQAQENLAANSNFTQSA